jgi:uncharacterized delta-60 repeat protein
MYKNILKDIKSLRLVNIKIKNNIYKILKLITLIFFFKCNLLNSGPSYATSIALDLNNNLVVSANLYDPIRNVSALTVIKYNKDGSLDTNFNPTGTQPGIFILEVFSGLNPIDITINSITVDNNNRILITGIAQYKFSDPTLTKFLIVARLTPNGNLDETFNPLSTIPGLNILSTTGENIGGNAITIDSDNKIIIAGFIDDTNTSYMLVVKLNEDGSLDTSFQNGSVKISVFGNTLDENDIATAVTVDNNNNIIVAGVSTIQQVITNQVSISRPITIFAIVNIDQNGNLNPNFGDTFSGITTTKITGLDYLTSITIDSANRIVVGGYTIIGATQLAPNVDNPVSNSQFTLARYLYNGQLDTTFGSSGNALTQNYIKNIPGVVVTNLNGDTDNIYGIAIDNNNKIVATGTGNIGAPTSVSSNNNIANSNIPSNLAGQADATVASTNLQLQTPSVNAFTSARYNIDGSLDTTFNPTGTNSLRAGIVVTSVINNTYPSTIISSHASALLIDNNNKIVTAGRSNNGIFNDVTLVRYNNDGSLDTTFNDAHLSLVPGVVITSILLGNNPYGPQNQNFDKINKMISEKELKDFIPDLESLESYKSRHNLHNLKEENNNKDIKMYIKNIQLKDIKNIKKEENNNRYKKDPIINKQNIIKIEFDTKNLNDNIFNDKKRDITFTNSKNILLKIYSLPENSIEIYINNKLVKNIITSKKGDTQTDIELNKGVNNLKILDKYRNENRFKVIYNDTIKNQPIILNPINNSIESRIIHFKGTAEPYSQIDLYINKKLIDSTYCNERGMWSFYKDYNIKDGTKVNTYITSKDFATNKILKSKPINFSIETNNNNNLNIKKLNIKITKENNKKYLTFNIKKGQSINIYINNKNILNKTYNSNKNEKIDIDKYNSKDNNTIKILIKEKDNHPLIIERQI